MSEQVVELQKVTRGRKRPSKLQLSFTNDENVCLLQTPPGKRVCRTQKRNPLTKSLSSPLKCLDENTLMEFPSDNKVTKSHENSNEFPDVFHEDRTPYGWKKNLFRINSLSSKVSSVDKENNVFESSSSVMMSSASRSSSCSTESANSLNSISSPLSLHQTQSRQVYNWSNALARPSNIVSSSAVQHTPLKSQVNFLVPLTPLFGSLEISNDSPVDQNATLCLDSSPINEPLIHSPPHIFPIQSTIYSETPVRAKSDTYHLSPSLKPQMKRAITFDQSLNRDKDRYESSSSTCSTLERSFSTVLPVNYEHIDACIRARDDLQLTGDNCHRHTLPISRSSDVNYVSVDTIAHLISSVRDPNVCDYEIVIMDCRYEYEYQGGHIRNAVNVHPEMGLAQALNMLEVFQKEKECSPLSNVDRLTTYRSKSSKLLLVFHCEFSSHRAPNLARRLRSEDRKKNLHRYPFLHLPEIYVMEGGYSTFYRHYPHLCEPQSYVSMFDPQFRNQLNLARKPHSSSLENKPTPKFGALFRRQFNVNDEDSSTNV